MPTLTGEGHADGCACIHCGYDRLERERNEAREIARELWPLARFLEPEEKAGREAAYPWLKEGNDADAAR